MRRRYASSLALFDRRGDDVAVFGPTAVVVLHVLEAEQKVQHKPGVTRTFADAAIGDGRLLRINPLLLEVNPLQLLGGFEGAVVLDRRAPRYALDSGDMIAAMLGLAHSWRRDVLADDFVR